MPILVWGGRLLTAFMVYDGAKTVVTKGEESVGDIAKAVPWIVGGLALYLLVLKRK